VGPGGYTTKYFIFIRDMHMLGVSEVVVSVLLLLVTVLLAAAVVSIFFNVVYSPTQSQFVIESAKPPCTARVVAVADNGSGYARIYVYNRGNSLCIFDTVYAVSGGAVVDRGSIYLRVQPGQVGFIDTAVRYMPGWVYRLTGPRGEVAEGRP
jgi:FlaG/FlaF family flagellin (archaellin)